MDRGVSVPSTPIVRAAVSADPAHGFEAFYELELEMQVRRAALLTGDAELARDLVHDAFVDLYRRWDTVAGPGAYLNTAVLNRCRDHARRQGVARRRLPLLVQRDEPPVADDPLFEALLSLPFNHRAALVLRYYHGLTEAEIAAELGCRPGSVGPWISRGLKQLRKVLS